MEKELKDKVWEKGIKVDGYDEALIRKDVCGAWIFHEEYGNVDSDFGWEIDHVYPKELGGGDELINLRPMQWQNNRTKGDDYPSYRAAVTSDEDSNIELERNMTINTKLREKLRELYMNNDSI